MSTFAVRTKNLSVTFGEFKAVNQISFEVSTGEIFGFLGANGAGKTTTIRVLCGLLTPTSGLAEICGIQLRPDSVSDTNVQIKQSGLYVSEVHTLRRSDRG